MSMITGRHLTINPMPRMPLRARVIIETVLRDHHLHAEDFYSTGRGKDLVEARRDAGKKLIEIGYSSTRIGRMLKRDHSTVLNYLDIHRKRKGEYYAGKALMKHLTPEARQIVLDYAKTENVKPHVVIAQWINERATYEAEAKLRAA